MNGDFTGISTKVKLIPMIYMKKWFFSGEEIAKISFKHDLWERCIDADLENCWSIGESRKLFFFIEGVKINAIRLQTTAYKILTPSRKCRYNY